MSKREANRRYATQRNTEILGHCAHCGKPWYGHNKKGQWWSPNQYFNVPPGLWCGKCYDLVSHDAYGKPRNPKAYERILIMHALKNGVEHA